MCSSSMATAKDEYLQTCSDWFSFHLSHVDDFDVAVAESLWPECEKCRVFYESLNYTSHDGEFGLMPREVIENLIKRERLKPKLDSSLHDVRRGNVPQYISFVTPVPVHLRPGTGESSARYESPGVTIVTEDLLSTGTQNEIIDDGELETRLEIGIRDRRLGLAEGYEATTKKDVDVACSQDVLFSISSQFSKFSLSQHGDSGNDEEESVVDAGCSQSPKEREVDGDMVNGEFEIDEGDDEKAKHSTEIQGFDFEEIYKDSKSGLANSSVDDLDENLDINLTTEVDDFNDSDGNRGTYKDNDDLMDTSDLEGMTNGVDPCLSGDQDHTNKENVSDNNNNNLQVTFAEPLTTDGRSSTNATDNDAGANRGQPQSILKRNDTKSKKYELAVDPSMIKKKISPVEESRTTLVRPVVNRREADLRPQSRPNLDIPDETTGSKKKESNNWDDEDQEATDGDNSSDAEYISDHGSFKIRRAKPKNSIYAKRANLKARNEILHKRKTSDPTEDDGMSAESSLLKQQILEQEKRLKEGMKPWLKGRLGLSQQNSRFEIPMDVRLLETMTPLEYLANYCVISKRRKALYKHVFQKVDRNRDGSVNYTELEKGLKDVHTGVLDSGHVENITQMVNIDKEGAFDLKQFSAVAAFSERISCKYQLPMESLNNLDGQKEVIESADFFALSWKLDGIRVNPAVKNILDSL